MDRWCIHPALDGLRLLNTKISLVQTIGQYELPGMKTRGGQSIVRARGHAVTRMGRGATRVDGADQGRRGGGGNRRKKISDLFWDFVPTSPKVVWAKWAQAVLATGQSTAVDHLMSEVMSEVSEDCQK